jgi:hypothetical protein
VIINEQIGRMTFLTKATRVPDRVLQAAKEAGGCVTKIPGEDLCCVRCTLGDACYNVVNEWVSTLLDADPFVSAIFAPSQGTQGTPLCPRHEIGYPIQVEASSIVHHYAPLDNEDFLAGPPVLPGPLLGAVHHVPLQHAQIALHALHARIQSVNDPNYPVLSTLPRLSYVCDVSVEWSNASVIAAIFKP